MSGGLKEMVLKISIILKFMGDELVFRVFGLFDGINIKDVDGGLFFRKEKLVFGFML